jgi:hypothetical protein
MDNTPIHFIYPNPETLPAIPLALMLLGKAVSTPALTFSNLHATRLPAYIGTLRQLGLGSAIIAQDLPLTAKQRSRRHRKPFAQYYLTPWLIHKERARGTPWALKVLELHEVDANHFPFSNEWRESGGD